MTSPREPAPAPVPSITFCATCAHASDLHARGPCIVKGCPCRAMIPGGRAERVKGDE